MSIQVNQVRGDIVELIFNPKEVDLHVGENLLIQERDGDRGLIAQIVEFRTVTYPSFIREQLLLALEDTPGERFPDHLFRYLAEFPLSTADREVRNLNIAVAKIRKLAGPRWDRWDGWIPTREVEIERVDHRELMANCIDDFGNRLHIGYTLDGGHFVPFTIEGQALEKVNVITGVKGSGKSYLAKVLLMELIKLGAPCIVFDLNREYIHLPPHEVGPEGQKTKMKTRTGRRGVIVLRAGEGGNLKMGVEEFGLGPLLTMLTKFGLPEVSSLYFENRVFKLLEEAKRLRQNGRKIFLGIDQLIQLAEEGEFADNEVVNNAIRSRLEAVKNTGVFASSPLEVVSIPKQYEKIRDGGALVIDISGLGNLARFGFVQSIVELIKEICEREIAAGTNRFPFVFFEEAHLYVSRNTIGYIVTRSRHLGITSFFITNMIGGLDEAVLRQMDNLFIMHLPYDDDVKHLGKSALLDQETLTSFVKRLRDYHALVIGNVTRQFPIIIRVKELRGINTAGETRFFFKRGRERPLPLEPEEVPLQ
ncbi:TPA: ATP-binding protein [Candidatus Bipolaricaulota bacterium]|nr:ATP-binding protein [Candidatus Bipolaricaulota bacterium]